MIDVIVVWALVRSMIFSDPYLRPVLAHQKWSSFGDQVRLT